MFPMTEKQQVFGRVLKGVPQFEKLLSDMLQEELLSLPNTPLDKVQVVQGRALLLQELLREFKYVASL